MNKYPANRVELIQKAVIAKMLSLVLIESNSYEQSLKECVMHFNQLYHKDPDKVYRILITDYQIAKFFAEYVANLSGFVDFLKSPNNIESIKSLTLQEIPQSMATEENKQTVKFDNVEFQKDVLKAMKFFISKGKTFDESIEASHKAFAKKEGFTNATKDDVVSALAEKCFNSIQFMQKEPLKNILFLVKLLSPEEIIELKSKL